MISLRFLLKMVLFSCALIQCIYADDNDEILRCEELRKGLGGLKIVVPHFTPPLDEIDVAGDRALTELMANLPRTSNELGFALIDTTSKNDIGFVSYLIENPVFANLFNRNIVVATLSAAANYGNVVIVAILLNKSQIQ